MTLTKAVTPLDPIIDEVDAKITYRYNLVVRDNGAEVINETFSVQRNIGQDPPVDDFVAHFQPYIDNYASGATGGEDPTYTSAADQIGAGLNLPGPTL